MVIGIIGLLILIILLIIMEILNNMAAPAIKVWNTEKTIANIMKFQNLAERELGFKMLTVVDAIVQDAKYLAPVRTGYLRDHIRGHVLRKKVWVIGKVVSPAFYSLYQEFGAIGRNQPHPYMRPAFKKNIHKIEKLLADTLRGAMIKAEYKGNFVRENL